MAADDFGPHRDFDRYRAGLVRRRPQKNWSFEDTMMMCLAGLAGITLWNGMSQLMDTQSAFDKFKLLVFCAGGCVASLGVNLSALKFGAPAWALNHKGTAIIAGLSIVLVGAALALASITGQIKDDVERLVFGEHERLELAPAVDAVKRASEKGGDIGGQIAAVVKSAGSSIEACERAGTCEWGSPPGEGRVMRTLGPLVAELTALAGTLSKSGGGAYAAELRALDDDLNAYRARLQKGGPVGLLRIDLQGLDTRIRGRLVKVREAKGLGTGTQIVKRLQAGVSVSTRPQAQAGINAVLAATADRVSGVLDTSDGSAAPTPASYPARLGVLDLLPWVLVFLPVTGFILAFEVVLPLLIFIYRCKALEIIGGNIPFDDDRPPPPSASSKAFAPFERVGP